MAREYAQVRLTIWTDPDFLALPADAQRVFMLALTQPGLNACGVVPYTVRRWAALAADTQPVRVRRAVTHLEAGRFVVVDEDTEELFVRSFMRHDKILDKPNLCRSAALAYPLILSTIVRRAFLLELHRLRDEMKGSDKGWEYLAETLAELIPEPIGEPFPEPIPEGSAEPFTEPIEKPPVRAPARQTATTTATATAPATPVADLGTKTKPAVTRASRPPPPARASAHDEPPY